METRSTAISIVKKSIAQKTSQIIEFLDVNQEFFLAPFQDPVNFSFFSQTYGMENAIQSLSNDIIIALNKSYNPFWRAHSKYRRAIIELANGNGKEINEFLKKNPHMVNALKKHSCNPIISEWYKTQPIQIQQNNLERKNTYPAQKHYHLAKYFSNQGKFDLAILELNKSIHLMPKFSASYNRRGNVYRAQKNFSAAISDYFQAIQLDPDVSQYYFNLALVYQDQNKFEQAVEAYSKAIQLDPQDVDAYFNRGEIYMEKRQFEQAFIDFTKAIQLDPTHENTISNLTNIAEYFEKEEIFCIIKKFPHAHQIELLRQCLNAETLLGKRFHKPEGRIEETFGVLDSAIFRKIKKQLTNIKIQSVITIQRFFRSRNGSNRQKPEEVVNSNLNPVNTR